MLFRSSLVFWARNKVGTSRKVVHRTFKWTYVTWVRSGYSEIGVRFPEKKVKLDGSRVLARAASKWSKFQAVSRSRVGSMALHQRVPSAASPAVVFNVTNVVGLALPANGTAGPASGMFAVRTDGTVVDSLMDGSSSAIVRDFFAAPNGRFYVTFTSPTVLAVGQPACVLAEVDSDTGIASCVDFSISWVSLSAQSSSDVVEYAPVQFDDAGNIYYTGTDSGKFVLRKSAGGVVTNMINDNITLKAFVVIGDGSVLVNGVTISSGTEFMRRISASNTVENLLAQDSRVTFVRKFPDGNSYIGVSSACDCVQRFLSTTGRLDPKPWLNPAQSVVIATFKFPIWQSFVSGRQYNFNPSEVQRLAVSKNGYVLGVLGQFGGAGKLYHYYPSPQRGDSTLVAVTALQTVGSRFVLAGQDANGTNLLTLYDPVTMQETVLLDSSNEVEVYHVGYSEAAKRLYFNGLRFSDNRLVVGEVDLQDS